ncbi:MAG: NUDIX domain-containing protein [Deltaproteobacteria bacterium]|nr:NUDIX domain-containing protein [Deltaproteobacteria bacterium]
MIVGVGVIVENDGQILLGERLSDPCAKTWSLPGGKFEPYESIIDCAERELKEETGLVASQVKSVFAVSVYSSPIEEFHTVSFGVACESFYGKAENLEPHKFLEWRWFSLKDLPEPLFPPTASILQAYFKQKVLPYDTRSLEMMTGEHSCYLL